MSSEEYIKLGILIGIEVKSLSPLMQNNFMNTLNMKGEYKSYPVSPEDLDSFLSQKQSDSLDGFNVTICRPLEIRTAYIQNVTAYINAAFVQ